MNLKTNTYVLFLTFGLMLAAVPALAHDSHHGSSAVTAEGQGVLQAINTEARTVTLSHEPIPELRWPAMEMDLPLRESGNGERLPCWRCRAFHPGAGGETDYEIIELQPLD